MSLNIQIIAFSQQNQQTGTLCHILQQMSVDPNT